MTRPGRRASPMAETAGSGRKRKSDVWRLVLPLFYATIDYSNGDAPTPKTAPRTDKGDFP